MWAGSYDLFDTVLLERLDVRLAATLEGKFVSRAPGRIAGALFFVAKQREVDTPFLHHLDHGTAGFDVAIDHRPGTPHPEQRVCFVAPAVDLDV